MSHEMNTLFPGGVNSPVRALKAVGGGNFTVACGDGPYLVTTEGNRYVDYVGGFGPAILGHSHPDVVASLQEAVGRGFSFGATNHLEAALALRIQEAMPHLERLRFVSSGTEAAMTAIRLARGATGRDIIIKCDGGYHGHADALLVAAGSGVATLGVSGSTGVPEGVIADTMSIPYNDEAALASCLQANAGKVAALLLEPVAGNMGFVRPNAGYLQRVRQLCDEYGVLLILDEVMTGFRVAWGGAQSLYGVRADITLLGKVIGGGMPVGALGGAADLMDHLAPVGSVYQAGTLSGNRMTMACGLATLDFIQSTPDFYACLQAKAEKMVAPMLVASVAAGMDVSFGVLGGMFGIHFCKQPLENEVQAKKQDAALFSRFFQHMLSRGIYWPPSMYEVGFMSWAHQDELLTQTGQALVDSVVLLQDSFV
jgi:glutamate-1-semialdehyde 2,1-aminomutase